MNEWIGCSDLWAEVTPWPDHRQHFRNPTVCFTPLSKGSYIKIVFCTLQANGGSASVAGLRQIGITYWSSETTEAQRTASTYLLWNLSRVCPSTKGRPHISSLTKQRSPWTWENCGFDTHSSACLHTHTHTRRELLLHLQIHVLPLKKQKVMNVFFSEDLHLKLNIHPCLLSFFLRVKGILEGADNVALLDNLLPLSGNSTWSRYGNGEWEKPQWWTGPGSFITIVR